MKKVITAVLSASILLVASCGTTKKISRLSQQQTRAELTLPKEKQVEFHEFRDNYKPADTLMVVDIDGGQSLIMNAVKEEATGEMVAHDVIRAAVVTARFRNVPERHGMIDLEYQIHVPESMLDKEWQLRFSPRMAVMGDTLSLDEVYITGSDYRREQDRGYMRYRRFINSIVTDSTLFVNITQLERFIERNLPDVYRLKQDSTFVSEARFQSIFGVTQQDAIEHYTWKLLRRRNEWKMANRERMFRKYVKTPYAEGARLDTVLFDTQGGFVYNYVQTITAKPKLRKVEIMLAGNIYEQEKRLYSIPESDPLTFYISSLSSFVSEKERYLSKTIYRQVEENTACYIDFQAGKDNINDTLSHNAEEIGRIKGNLASLMDNQEFDLDSIVVTASGSPEGSFELNRNLSGRRSHSATKYFEKYLRHYADSLNKAKGLSFNLDDTFETQKALSANDIKFIACTLPENWEMLDALVRNDVVMNDGDKEEYFSHEKVKDLDAREIAMHSDRKYRYYRQVLYPRTRTVKFDFFLHRKGMIEESVLTTVLDTVYMNGVQAIRDRDYEKAVTALRPYNDYNTAVAYCAMDYNASALNILEGLEKTGEVNYLLSVIYSRQGKDREAVECYLNSCKQNPSFVHRGNLDPEISSLIRQYGLNRQEEYTQ